MKARPTSIRLGAGFIGGNGGRTRRSAPTPPHCGGEGLQTVRAGGLRGGTPLGAVATAPVLNVLLLVIILALGACAAGHSGGDAIAFVRGSRVYRIYSDGQGLYALTGKSAIGFAWAPDHHDLVVRFAATAIVPQPRAALTGEAPDTLAVLGVVSVDGGNVMTITPSFVAPRSDPWWDATGNRMIYREQDSANQWIQSQADQPVGIARKTVASSANIPTTAPDGSQIATITPEGNLVIGPPEQTPVILRRDALVALPGVAWPARPLWQPDHSAILYPAAGPNAAEVTLMLTDLHGAAQPVATVAQLEEYAWSPDGNRLLLRTPAGYIMHALDGAPDRVWADPSALSVPWWSPDGRYVLIRSETALDLITVATGQEQRLATFAAPAAPFAPQAGWLAAAHPVTGSPWQPSGQSFALVTPGGHWRNGADLATRSGAGDGLYIVSVSGAVAAPKLVEWGEHSDLSWSTPDPNTQFLTP